MMRRSESTVNGDGAGRNVPWSGVGSHTALQEEGLTWRECLFWQGTG